MKLKLISINERSPSPIFSEVFFEVMPAYAKVRRKWRSFIKTGEVKASLDFDSLLGLFCSPICSAKKRWK